MRGAFVTGTGTGVGKTFVAAALLKALRARGLSVDGFKPIETGNGEDARQLARAAGKSVDPSRISAYRFPSPVAPAVAAAAAGIRIRLDKIKGIYQSRGQTVDFIVVEGAGGLLTTISRRRTMADLASALGLPLLIIAANRLGAINETLLTMEAASNRGLTVAGILLNDRDTRLTPARETNPAFFQLLFKKYYLGAIPYNGEGEWIETVLAALVATPRRKRSPAGRDLRKPSG